MASQGLRPAHIRVGMARRFGLSEAEMPTLRQMQRFISHYTKKTLHRNDDHDEILDQIEQLAYGPEVSDTSPFSFGWERDIRGKPDVSNGSDEKPFLVGLPTKRLLLNAARDPALFVFHMNATFKLNHVAYPAIVCGVSDRCRSCHFVSLFVTSQRLEGLYVRALSSLRKVFMDITGKQVFVQYVMADADAAQLNAVNQGFGVDSDYAYLTCFYHVMAKVHEKLKGVPDSLCERVAADIYDLQFAASKELYDEQVKIVLEKWSREERLAGFRNYFNNIWMMSELWRWQCFHTPSGYATTNNPVGKFNLLTKRDYTLRTKHKIGTLLQLLADCCGHQSVTPRKFKEQPDASQQLKARIEFLLVSPYPNVVRVLPRGCHRVYLPELGRSREVAPVAAQMGSN
ncbi:hypothetical protein PI124_g3736 [Phytophthora idaei]|nr:hypothetical protein PI124_g3736 [Phytophthora idaei]